MLINPTPITTEPVPAKTFDKLHLHSLVAIHPHVGEGTITIGLLPATSDGHLAEDDKIQRISCPLYPALNEVPALASAFEAVLAAIPETQEWIKSKASPTSSANI